MNLVVLTFFQISGPDERMHIKDDANANLLKSENQSYNKLINLITRDFMPNRPEFYFEIQIPILCIKLFVDYSLRLKR